jgi:hypothetical protein
MEIKSISSIFTQYFNRVREIVYTTKVDPKSNNEIVEQVVYYRPNNDGVKGVNVDVKV